LLKPKLERVLGLKEATALNMIDMVGIGPFVVIPFVIDVLNGGNALWAWLFGAVIATIDAFTWSELGARYPEAGGSYNFLREAYKESRFGRLFPFLFIWQTSIQAPLVIASGAIGFSQYLSYIIRLSPVETKAVSGLVVVLLTALLYRKIGAIGKISLALWVGVLGTIGWIIFSGATHFNSTLFQSSFSGGNLLAFPFFAALGMASVKTIYCYLGYYNVCHLGSEIQEPQTIIPKSMFLSIAGIAILYLAMNISVLGVVPVNAARHSPFIISDFMERIYGHTTALFATGLTLWIAFASLFAVILGYSRIPYAAALDGNFFRIFSRLHPQKHFPHISLLFLGGVAFVFSLLFRLAEVIQAIIAMRIMV
jgi:amino acid transporter